MCYPSLSLRWAHRPVEKLSLRIHLPSPPPPHPPPPLHCYHDNIDRSLKLKQQGRPDPPLSLSFSFSLLPVFLWHPLALLISQSVSFPLSFHRGEGKVGHNPKNKSPAKNPSPFGSGSERCSRRARRRAPKSPAAIVLAANPKMIDVEGKNSKRISQCCSLLIKSSPKTILIFLILLQKKKSPLALHTNMTKPQLGGDLIKGFYLTRLNSFQVLNQDRLIIQLVVY